MKTIEILRDTLLAGALIILVYVLYKRMLRVIGKDHVVAKYPNLGNALEWREEGKGEISVDLKEKMYLIVEVFDQQNQRVLQVAEGEYEMGEHQFTFEKNALRQGKFYYKVTSPLQQASQYFEIG